MKFFIKDFFSKCDQIRKKLRIGSHLLKKPLLENFIFWVVENCKDAENQTFTNEFNWSSQYQNHVRIKRSLIYTKKTLDKKRIWRFQPSKAYMRNLQEFSIYVIIFKLTFQDTRHAKSEIYLKTLLNIYDGAFYENSKQLLAVNYFCKKFYHGCFTSS